MRCRRKICVVTGSRADYGLLYPILKSLRGDSDVALQIAATGMHLSEAFGETFRAIEQDGFVIDGKVPTLIFEDSEVGTTKAIAAGISGFADLWDRLKPDLVLVLGDRFEIFAAATAASIARIPIGHIHGGETTEGAFDEALRHSITKMAQYHFTSTETYRKRVVQLGENPERVFCVGAPGLDNIAGEEWLDRKTFLQKAGLPSVAPYFLITYHPATLEGGAGVRDHLDALFEACDAFPEYGLLFTKSNADTDGLKIGKGIDQYVAANKNRAVAHISLGRENYLNAVYHSELVLGNSSSGIIEVPAFSKPTINIGDRQKGRVMGGSVISVPATPESIRKGIEKGLQRDFRAGLKDLENPYGRGGASEKIVRILKQVSVDPGILKKKFYDL